jgi:nucleoside-diphosphate-sugar epimerase
MQCFVTGTSGRIGSAIVTELLAHGHTVVATDQNPPQTPVDAPEGVYRFIQMELDQVEPIKAAMTGCDALIHMAAIPSPGRHPDEVVFNNNMTAAFNTFQAASLLDIRKAVVASSLSALGTVWAPKQFLPHYVPMDEQHPLAPHDCYSLSKGLVEDIAKMFHRRTGMQVAAMRFPWVIRPSELPDAVKNVNEHLAEYAPHFWTYVDVRDAATACRQAIEADNLGYDCFDITAADTIAERPTMDLLAEFAPGVEIREQIAGNNAAYPCRRAAQAFGYAPKWSWRQAV